MPTILEKTDDRGRKILRVKLSPEELHAELVRLQTKHLLFLSQSKRIPIDGDERTEQDKP